MKAIQRRAVYGLGIAAAIGLGLLVRAKWLCLPHVVSKYSGDMLWSVMVLMAIGFCFPRARVSKIASAALAVSFAVEFSQLYHAPWIDAIRGTQLGTLAPGNTFAWPDLVAYTAGVLLGALATR